KPSHSEQVFTPSPTVKKSRPRASYDTYTAYPDSPYKTPFTQHLLHQTPEDLRSTYDLSDEPFTPYETLYYKSDLEIPYIHLEDDYDEEGYYKHFHYEYLEDTSSDTYRHTDEDYTLDTNRNDKIPWNDGYQRF